MPRLADPERGWIATANHRPAPEDFPYPLSGTWGSGYRALRIRKMIEGGHTFSLEEFMEIQQDALSLRAVHCLPGLLKVLEQSNDPRIRETINHLRAWDCRMEADRGGATIFDVFLAAWTKSVLYQRVTGDVAALLAGGADGLAAKLLTEDRADWFAPGKREKAIHAAMTTALRTLTERLGPEMNEWAWGRLHTLPLHHVLSGRGDLAALLDRGGVPVKGDAGTVCNTGLGGSYEARSGANYRLIADMALSPPGLWAVDCESASGHPGSPHYGDQLGDWLEGRYHWLPLDRNEASKAAVAQITLEPV
jgi:penicillin amidase